MVLHVLIVDDDEEDRALLREAFRTVDPEMMCYEACDGSDALSFLNTATILPDFIFLDLNMPRINGFQFLKEIKKAKHFKDISVVIYSTSKQQREKDIAHSLGALHFITKPYKFSDLQNEIHYVLEKWTKVHS